MKKLKFSNFVEDCLSRGVAAMEPFIHEKKSERLRRAKEMYSRIRKDEGIRGIYQFRHAMFAAARQDEYRYSDAMAVVNVLFYAHERASRKNRKPSAKSQ